MYATSVDTSTPHFFHFKSLSIEQVFARYSSQGSLIKWLLYKNLWQFKG